MAGLPRVSGRETMKAFQSVGYELVRQSGSHLRLRDATGTRQPLTVPDHRELRSGLLRALIRDAGMTVEELVRALG
jgi:predicted RNA binding protein YcfA (HicA-like mRNA interferase family)